MPLCSVSLPLFPIRGKACFPPLESELVFWLALAKRKWQKWYSFEFQSLGLKTPWSFCFCHLGGLGLHGSPVILIARPFEERVREREREKEREKKGVRKRQRERNPRDWKISKRVPGEWKTLRKETAVFQPFNWGARGEWGHLGSSSPNWSCWVSSALTTWNIDKSS